MLQLIQELCQLPGVSSFEEPVRDFIRARVAPYAKYVHAKDFIWKSYKDADPGEGAFRTRAGNFLRGTIVGHGNVPVQQCLHILKAAGFDGAMALEFEGVEDPFTALRIGLCNLRLYWAQA